MKINIGLAAGTIRERRHARQHDICAVSLSACYLTPWELYSVVPFLHGKSPSFLQTQDEFYAVHQSKRTTCMRRRYLPCHPIYAKGVLTATFYRPLIMRSDHFFTGELVTAVYTCHYCFVIE